MAHYIKCSPEIHQRVKVKAAQTGKDMQEIAEEAIRAYFAAGTRPASLGLNKSSEAETFTPETAPSVVRSDIQSEILATLDRIVNRIEHGELGRDQTWKDFDDRMGELAAATNRLEQITRNSRNIGESVPSRRKGAVRPPGKGRAS